MAPASDVKKMKVQELKDALAARGLDTAGLKADLAARLEQAMQLEQDLGLDGSAAAAKDGTTAGAAAPSKPAEPAKNAAPSSGPAAAPAAHKAAAPAARTDGNGAGASTEEEVVKSRAARFGQAPPEDIRVKDRAARFGISLEEAEAATKGGKEGKGKGKGAAEEDPLDPEEIKRVQERAKRFGIVTKEEIEVKKKSRLDRFKSPEEQAAEERKKRFG